MCVIIHQPAGVTIPRHILQSAYRKNPHGWGIMTAARVPGTVSVAKGLGFQEFMRSYESLKGKACVIHCRVRTHGPVDLDNCHPFRVAKGLYLMHNGVIQGLDLHRRDRSDSWHFAQLLGQSMQDVNQIHEAEVLESVAAIVGMHNRVAFLTSDGRVSIANYNQGCLYRGLWFSNTYGWTDTTNPDSPDDDQTAQALGLVPEPDEEQDWDAMCRVNPRTQRGRVPSSVASRATMGITDPMAQDWGSTRRAVYYDAKTGGRL
jgi:hypothetical protein